MQQIRPVADLRSKIGEITREVVEEQRPVILTKNGRGHMVLISYAEYERTMFQNDIVAKVKSAEQTIAAGRVSDPFDSLAELRREYGL